MTTNDKILIPLPSYGFDPTEAAIPWKIFSASGFNVKFATPDGKKANADQIMLTGEGLGIFKNLLKARKDAVDAYNKMYKSPSFNQPVKYSEIDPGDFQAIFLPGGHHKGVKEYLESDILHKILPYFFKQNKPVGAVCHGPLLLARSIDTETGQSVLYDYKTTSLLKIQELAAYYLTKHRLGEYYLTYPGTTVQDEVIASLRDHNQFVKGPLPVFRDSLTNLKFGFCLVDRNYVSARWPGDIYNLSNCFLELLSLKSILS